ncbi:MAG: DUF4340 domain-containing protein, partial [Planctomycetota bacterium]
MKNQKNLAILGALTILALAAAGVSALFGGGDDLPADLGRLVPALEERINDVAKLRVAKADGARTFVQKDGVWSVEECAGFPADFSKVKEAIFSVANLEIEAKKTKVPAKHAQLGVEDPGAAEAKSTGVTFWDAAGAELAAVVVGEPKYRQGGQSVFARRAGEDQVYECGGRVNLHTDLRSWVDPAILRIPASRVRHATIAHADGERVEIERQPGEGDRFGIVAIPAGRTEKYAGVASSLGSTLATLDLDDVRPAADIAFEGDSLVTSEFAVDAGLAVIVRSVKLEDKTWIHVAARYDPPVGPPAIVPPPSEAGPPAGDGVPPPGEAGLPADAGALPPAEPGSGSAEGGEAPPPDPGEALRKEADEINAKHGPWAYAVPSYRGDNLRKRLEDLLAAPPAPETPAPADESGGEPPGGEAPPAEGA